MNVEQIPLRPNQLSRRYRPANIIGTANIDTAHVLPEPRKIKSTKPGLFRGESHVSNIDDDEHKFKYKMAFETTTDKKIVNRRIQHRMRQEMEKYEENVNRRRNKLRQLLADDEQSLSLELEKRINEMKNERKENSKCLREKEEKEQLESQQLQVSTKRVQQYLARSAEARENFRKQSTTDVKSCNLVQMREKAAKIECEKQMEGVWHKMALDKVERKKAEEEERANRLVQSKLDTAKNLKEQIEEKMAKQRQELEEKEAERKRLQELMESFRNESLNEMQKKQEERRKLRIELETQLENARTRIAEHKAEQAAVDQMFASSVQTDAVQNERIKYKISSQALHSELCAYMQSLKDFREQQAQRNREMDEMIDKVAQEAEVKRNQVKLQEQKAREKELQDTMQVREEQRRAKLEQREREREQRKLEDKVVLEQVESEEAKLIEKLKSKRLNAMRYAAELKAQKDEIQNRRKKEYEEIEQAYRRSLEQEQEYQRMIEQIVKQSASC